MNILDVIISFPDYTAPQSACTKLNRAHKQFSVQDKNKKIINR